ncbi:hypothetical protein AAC387_Pa09g1945 [Persea americana]
MSVVVPLMEVDMYSEANEDIFFADLRKRILLLTADEEDGFVTTTPTTPTSNFSPESGHMEFWKHKKTDSLLMMDGNVLGIPPLITAQPNMQNIWSWELQPNMANMVNIRSWELPRIECKGTGVFIPRLQSHRSRRKSNAGRTRSPMKI